MSYKWTNASELAEYLYCRRAWWFKNVQGLDSANVRHMRSGSRYHSRHGRRVGSLPWLRRVAYLLIFAAVALLVFQLAAGVW
jgi:hypothetical protein